MKEKLTRNIGLKILSVILAAILWLIITNVDDPVMKKDFINVKVDVANADTITSLGQVYEILEGETIDFSVAARRTIADTLKVSDFRVTADFSKLSDVNAVTINITSPRYGDDITVTDGLYQVMKISREELEEKNFKVTVVTKGNPAEGYFVGKKAANTIIKVSGPKTKIERIKEIVAEVDVSEVSETFRTIVKPKAFDEDGNEIDASNLTFSENNVTISIGIYKTKEINLRLTTTGEPAEGYVVTSVEYQPRTIEVAGEDEALDRIRYLNINEKIDGARKTIEKEIDLQEKLGEGLTLVGEDKTATVYIVIEKLETKDLMLWPSDIEIRNKPEDLKVSFNDPSAIALKVKAPLAELTDVSKKSLKPYIDLYGYSAGTYDVIVKADLKDHIIFEQSSTVGITLGHTIMDLGD
jgi:YbbR domain-containing protein